MYSKFTLAKNYFTVYIDKSQVLKRKKISLYWGSDSWQGLTMVKYFSST